MNNHDFEVEVLVRGRPVKFFKHNGEFYIEGRQGSKYELKVYNNTWNRVEVVASVDGMSVMEDGLAGPQNSGYLIPARSSIVIPGFRRNNSAVAEFKFGGKQDSYSNAMGEGTQNVGAIGFMFFKEKVVYRAPSLDSWNNTISTGSITVNSTDSMIFNSGSSGTLRHSSNNTAKGMISTADSFELGTEWGDEIAHKVQEVQFIRETMHPDKIITVYYDSRRGLEARGIQVVQTTVRPTYEKPNPFPGYNESGCSAPPGWKGKRR